MTTTSQLGSIVESLGVTLTLDEGDMVTDVVLLAQVIEADGTVRLGLTWSDGTSWILRNGMLNAAAQIESAVPGCRGGDDDE